MRRQPNIIPAMSREGYEAIRAVNWSKLKHIGKSPMHFKYALDEEWKDTPSLKLGRAVHVAVFEPQLFSNLYVIWEGGRRAGKEWKAFAEANADREILTVEEHEACAAMQRAVHEHPVAAPYVQGGQPEVAVTWDHRIPAAGDFPEVIFPCKGRLDYLRPDAIVDLKTARDGSIEGFGRATWNLRYHTQLAFYRDGYEAATGRRLRVKMIVVESAAPYVVTVFDVPEQVLELGREEYTALLHRLDWCNRQDEWPGYADGETELMLPRWVAGRDEGDDLSEMGLTFGEED